MSVAESIASQKAEHGVPHATACRALGVSQSWFYKWHDRPPTARRQRRAALDKAVSEAFQASQGLYGSPRITADFALRAGGCQENTVADLMACQGSGRAPRRRRSHHPAGRAGGGHRI